MAKRLPAVKSDPSSEWAEAKIEAAALAAQAVADEAAARELALYDKYSLREIGNATAISGFRRRGKPSGSELKTNSETKRQQALTRAVRLSEKAGDERDKAQSAADRLRATVDNPTLSGPVPADDSSKRIRQGVKASVETVPMPVRLEVTQVRMLKVLAAQDGTTASAIIRDCIKEHLGRRVSQDKAFADAVRAALKG
ncbi:hypothetical protein PQR57_04130 [Paraburkholderia dipogonis]|uniref:Ribbon-helix-helix protein, CopG family n=1 Tax=Paraburkholderia dipogonis TaxID=1211383 RepID=A0ABW9AJB2_9BURK